jgi:hypothetical protein
MLYEGQQRGTKVYTCQRRAHSLDFFTLLGGVRIYKGDIGLCIEIFFTSGVGALHEVKWSTWAVRLAEFCLLLVQCNLDS